MHDSLRNVVTKVGVDEYASTHLHTIFSMYLTQTNPEPCSHFRVKFKSPYIRSLILQKLDFPEHLETALMSAEYLKK